MNEVEKTNRLYNTPIESGLRLLFLLEALKPQSCDLQRITIYDYLLVHSGEVVDGPPSLHPPTPFQSGELLVRRDLVAEGLSFVQSKGLIEKSFTPSGIFYNANEETNSFLDYMGCLYAERCRENSVWIASEFQSYSDEDLTTFVRENLGKWNAGFEYESVIWDGAE